MASDLNQVLANGLYAGFAFYNGIHIREIAGRSGTDTTTGADTAQRTWRLSGTTSPQVARDALTDGPVLIDSYDGLMIESLSYDQGPSHDSWDFTASYNAAIPEVGGYTTAIDTSGGQILQTTSFSQTAYAAPGMTAPDFLKSIDVQDGKPQGVQRVVQNMKLQVRAKIATAYVKSPMYYSNLVAGLTGTMNASTMFDIYPPGSLLFIGAAGDVIAENPQLTFTFLVSKNESSLSVGGVTGISKRGHDYLWILFDHAKDPTTGVMISKPRAVYVDEIYDMADHTLLKIGEA